MIEWNFWFGVGESETVLSNFNSLVHFFLRIQEILDRDGNRLSILIEFDISGNLLAIKILKFANGVQKNQWKCINWKWKCEMIDKMMDVKLNFKFINAVEKWILKGYNLLN